MRLSLFHDQPDSSPAAASLSPELLNRVKQIDRAARENGLDALDSADPLVQLGMELTPKGKVTKNSYGVFHLAWLAAEHPEWAAQVENEVQEIQQRIRDAHRTKLRFIIWAGMGGSAEDKSMYQAAGLLKSGPRLYVLDSTDPAKLSAILADMCARSRMPLAQVLPRTLVVGMALGMTSYEPVVNLEKIAALYSKHGIDSRENILYLTLPGSLLDQFGQSHGLRRVPLQLDGGNSTSGRHSSPLTRGSLYPLALAGVDLKSWLQQTDLDEDDIAAAWRLSAFLYTQILAGRDKITLLLPKAWSGAAIWTKQDFEESLGKSETFGFKLVVGEKIRPLFYHSPKDQSQNRVFLSIQVKGGNGVEAQKVTLLRRAGYPVAVLSMNRPQLARYMQFIHYCVFGMAWLAKMNFVTQPGVEIYKSVTQEIVAEGEKNGGVEHTSAWKSLVDSGKKSVWLGRVTLAYEGWPKEIEISRETAPAIYCRLLRQAVESNVSSAELTYFGDTRYSSEGRAMRKLLDASADRLFRSRLKMPVDVYEGPAMNHSYHEMIIGHGRAFSTVVLPLKSEEIPAAKYTADYHRAQFLATREALLRKRRLVVALLLKDAEEASLKALDHFFREVARLWQSGRS